MEQYTKDKMYEIMDMTQCNQANMLKRLDRISKFSNFVLIYYSIVLIIYALTVIYFPKYYNSELSEYFSIIISIVILVFSIINGNSKYSERIKVTEATLNAIKSLKRELTDENLSAKTDEYNKIIDRMEYRAEVDFFNTLKQRCKEYNIRWYYYKEDIEKNKLTVNESRKKQLDKLNNYLSEDNPYLQELKILCNNILYGVIILMPILIFGVCFLVNLNP